MFSIKRKVGALALLALALTACGEDGAHKRDSTARDYIDITRTVSGESLATCLARAGFVFSSSYIGVNETIQAEYDKGEKEAVTINVDRQAGIVSPWDARDDKVLKQYHCQPSDYQDHSQHTPPVTANSSR